MEHYRPQMNKRPGGHKAKHDEDLLRRIPSEDTIKERFKMKIPVRIDAMENPISTIHVMENAAPGMAIIKDHARCIRRDLADLRRQEAAIKSDYEVFAKKTNAELDAMKLTITTRFADFWQQLRENAVEHQNGQVPIHKDIQKLRNDRNELTESMAGEFERVAKVEDVLFKKQVFDLETNDPGLAHPNVGILRREHAHLPDYTAIRRLPKSYDTMNERRRQADLFDR